MLFTEKRVDKEIIDYNLQVLGLIVQMKTKTDVAKNKEDMEYLSNFCPLIRDVVFDKLSYFIPKERGEKRGMMLLAAEQQSAEIAQYILIQIAARATIRGIDIKLKDKL